MNSTPAKINCLESQKLIQFLKRGVIEVETVKEVTLTSTVILTGSVKVAPAKVRAPPLSLYN
jgi:hypothetical protein